MNKNEILESFKTIHWSIDPLDSLQYYFVIKYIEKKIKKHPGKGSSTEIYNYNTCRSGWSAWESCSSLIVLGMV